MTDLTNFKGITTLSLNVDNNKTFKKREEAKSDDKIVESIVVSPKLLKSSSGREYVCRLYSGT